MLASWTKLLTISIAAALVGCKSGDPAPETPPWLAMQPLVPPVPVDAAPPAVATASWNAPAEGSDSVFRPVTITAQPPAVLPPPPQPPAEAIVPALTLLDAVEAGLAQNPELNALRYAEGVSEGAVGVAHAPLFNPYVQIQVTPGQHSQNPDTNVGPVSHYVLLQQQLQIAHQRRHRTAAAAAALNSVRWNFVQARLVNIATTQRLYFAALYQRGLAEIARANADVNAQLLDVSQKQFAAGEAAGVDVAILRLDSAAASRQALLAAANYETALLDLRRHLGVPPQASLALAGGLADWHWLPVDAEHAAWTPLVEMALPATSDKQLLAQALASGRPDVWAAASDVEAAQENLSLARASRVPDLIIGPYYLRSNDPTTYWGLRAQMDIPILNSGMPLVRQRLAELTQRHAVWEQLLSRATLDAYAALDRYERALLLAAEAPAAAGAQPPEELRRLEAQFQAREVDLVRIVTARTSFFQARRAALDALNEVAQASAVVVAATGLPPEALLKPAPHLPQ
ncbi:MAG TPA: TolC family protein [Pirellulaceae bacterium]|nr:TolC family protein [Pirellulaceae bacterium]